MFIEVLFSKIHRVTVTDADVNYVGSITIDETLIKKANLKLYQKVNIYNVTNGERFSTYVIKGKADSGCICLNGAAAHKVSKGDKIIIAAYATMTPEEADNFKPTLILVDEKNKFSKEL